MPPDPTDAHRDKLDALGTAILGDRGLLPVETRRAAATNPAVPEPFTAYVDTIHRHAYRLTDASVAGLGEAGASDDAIFEISVASAYGAARTRLDAGLAALRAATAQEPA
jgi:hypothetical protein